MGGFKEKEADKGEALCQKAESNNNFITGNRIKQKKYIFREP